MTEIERIERLYGAAPVTVAELLDRGMDGRMSEIVSLLAGEILRDPVTKSLSPDELAAFGFGSTCPCGERGLRPGETISDDGESCQDCRAKTEGDGNATQRQDGS